MTLKELGITPYQWRYYRFWIFAIFVTEGIMLIRNHDLYFMYLSISALFLCGLLLRIFKIYPGEEEPLILDFSGVLLALMFGFLAKWINTSLWRFLLILCSSTIVLPHFIYIATEKLENK